MGGSFEEEIYGKTGEVDELGINRSQYKGGNMSKGIGTRNGMAGIVFFHLLAFAVLAGGALFTTESHAYSRYNDGCQSCHGAFTDSTSPKGTVFPGGNKHTMHNGASNMDTDCNLCHTSGDNRNPFLKSSDGLTGITGLGCTGCHNGAGLRQHHRVTGASQCSGCHASPEVPPAENTNPPYYGTSATKANNACNPVATANLNENWSVGDFEGLDDDGDNLYDTNDPNCASVTAGPMTVSPTAGLTSTGTAGGPFTPSSLSYTLTNTGTAPMIWTASKVQSWVTLSATGGTLAAGAGATVTVSIGTGANSLAAGSYSDNITFINTSNGTGNATRSVSLTVNTTNVSGPMTVTPAGGLTSSGTAGGPFSPSSQTYTLTNTGTSPMNWTASKVASWVTLSSTGGTLAAGTNTTVTASINAGANTLAAGSYSDNVTFTNTTSNTGNTTRPVSLTVNATEAPTISTVSLPAGAVDTAYSQTLTATGGTTPYSWSVSSGTLPAGLSLSALGVLSGTPTATGTSIFTVRVAGSDNASSTRIFDVTIDAAAPPPTVNLSSDSGGGGCSVAVRTGSGDSYIDGTLILAGLGLTVWGIRMRRRRS